MPSTPPGPARSTFRSLRWLALALLLASGCSASRLPTAPEQRLAPLASNGGNGQQARSDVAVTLTPGVDPQSVAAAHGATVRNSSWRCATLIPVQGQTTEGLIAELVLDSRVQSAENIVMAETAESRQQSFSFDDGVGSPQSFVGQVSVSMLGLEAAHAIGAGGGVRVAIVDTGVDLMHSAFAGHIVGAWDFLESDADPTDRGDALDDDGDGFIDEAFGHGTHVAGIVRLAAPDAQLLVARVLSAEGHGDMLDVARAIRWAVANGARVINLSLGSITKSDAVTLALTEAADAGVVCVTSAGNTATDTPVDFPACSRYTVAVAAIQSNCVPTSFTSYGDFVEICAPGQSIRSAFPGGGYALWSGTSMSAPFVSGGIALLIPFHPEWTPKRLLDRLTSTAGYINQAAYSNGLGAGALNLGAALTIEALGDPFGSHVIN